MLEEIKKSLTSQKTPSELILVKEGKIGIETYYNEDLIRLPGPYKKQLVEFLEGIVKELEK